MVVGAASAAFPGRNGRIAYTRSTDVALHYDIFTMRSDGAVKRNITSSATDEFDPAWSADGTKIAFVEGFNGVNRVLVMNGDGTGVAPILDTPSFQFGPSWSPDGSELIFVRTPE